MEIASIAGLVLLLTFSAFVLKKRGKTRADYVLLVINGLLAVSILSGMWVLRGMHSLNFIVLSITPFLLFPVFISYVLEYVQLKQKKLLLWMYFPALAFLLFLVGDHYLWNAYDLDKLHSLYHEPPWTYHVFYKTSQALFIGLCFWLLRYFKKHERSIRANFSSLGSIDLDWLRHMTLIYGSITVFSLVSFSLTNLGLLPTGIDEVYSAMNVVVVLAITYLNVNGIRHYTIAQYLKQNPLNVQEQSAEQLVIAEENTTDNKGKGLSEARAQSIYQGIEQLLQEQIYLTPQLKLMDLASALNETSHNVSEVLNTQFGKSFYDLINEHRVQHLKKLLRDPEKRQFTILALGLDSGFNSKASVNRIFKAQTGSTPLEYQKQHQLGS